MILYRDNESLYKAARIIINIGILFIFFNIFFIFHTGGYVFQIGVLKISSHSYRNPLLLLCFLLILRSLVTSKPFQIQNRLIGIKRSSDFIRSPEINANNYTSYLLTLFVISIFFRFFASLLNQATLVITDEIVYAKMAQSFSETGQFLYRGQMPRRVPFLYSFLISPAYYFSKTDNTFLVIKFINSILMSSVLFPTYFLAKKISDEKHAILTATASVLIGSMFYTATIMSENLYYPLFVLTFYVMYRSLAEPERSLKIFLGILFSLCLLTKMSAIGFIFSYLMILFIMGVVDTKKKSKSSTSFNFLVASFQNILHTFWSNKAVILTFVVLTFPWFYLKGLRYGFDTDGFLGRYALEATLQPGFDVLAVLKWLIIYFGQMGISTGVIVIAPATYCAYKCFRDDDSQYSVFGMCFVVSTLIIVAMTSYFSGYNSERLTERHFFMLTPIIFILFFKELKNKIEMSFSYIMITIVTTASMVFSLYAYHRSDLRHIDSASLFSFLQCTNLLKLELSQFNALLIILFPTLVIVFVLTKNRFKTLSMIYLVLFFLGMTAFEFHGIHSISKTYNRPKYDWITRIIGNKKNLVFLLDRHRITPPFIWNVEFWGKHNVLEIPAKHYKGVQTIPTGSLNTYGKKIHIVSTHPLPEENRFLKHNYGMYLYQLPDD